jgi:gas vesicle protein
MRDYQNADSNGGGFMVGLFTGALIGAGIGLLLAPKSGAELRKKLMSRAGELADTVEQAYGHATETVGDLAQRGTEAGREVYSAGRDLASRASSEAERFVDDVATRANRATDSFNRG